MLTPAWEAALGLLNQTAALRSVMLLTGDNGVGKSALAAPWLESLEPKLYLPLAITQATLSATGLMAVLLHKLGQPATLYRNRNLVALEKALAELGRLTPVLVRDEAQQYPPGALEEIRLLLGLNLSRQPTFALVLLGDPYLQDTLRLQHHRALYSRIAARCTLPVLEPAQIEPYLAHGLRQVGPERLAGVRPPWPCSAVPVAACLACLTSWPVALGWPLPKPGSTASSPSRSKVLWPSSPRQPIAAALKRNSLSAMPPEYSVLEELQAAYAIIAEVLSRAPQLYDCHLDQALLVLALSIKRAQRSPKLRPPRRYRPQELPF